MNIEFQVKNQIIERVDKNKVVADSRNYLFAVFDFSDEWNGTVTALFKKGKKSIEMLLENGRCPVPDEVITEGEFSVSCVCGDRITANKEYVSVEASGYEQGETPQPPTPDVYTQIIERLNNLSVGGNNDYTKLKNIPRRLVHDEDVNFDEKGIFEFMVPLSFTFRGDDSEGNRKEYTLQAEKGAILLSSGNFGNAHNKILITARDIYCEQYRDMEYRFNCLSEMVYDFSTLGTAFSMIYEQLSALSENMDSALSEVNDTVYALSDAFTQQQSKTEQKFTDVNKSIDALSESVNQEYLSRVDIEDVRIYTDENGNNKFQFDNATLAVTATGGNSYISDYIPITEKLRITGYAVQNTTMANGIAFVTYDSDKQPIQAYRGDTEISTFVYEKTAVITPEEAAFVRIRSRDNYNSRVKSKATVERFVGAKEKIEEMQVQLDSLLGLTAAAYAAEE